MVFISIIFSLIEFISSRFFFTLIIAATPTIGLRFPPKKTVVVMNYPKLSEFENFKPNKHKEHALIYIGSIGITRGIKELMLAFEKIKHKNFQRYRPINRLLPPLLSFTL